MTDPKNLELVYRLQRLSAMLDSAMDAVIALDENQLIELFNPAAETMFQYRAADVIGQPLNVLLPDRYRSTHHDHVESFRTGDQTERHAGDLGLVRGLRADGSEFPLEVAISRSTVGGKTTLTAIARDATSRLEMEADVQASAARYQLLFEHSPLPMWVYDMESLRFIAVNDAAVADYGYGREEFLGMTIRDIRPPDELQNLDANLAASRQARQRSGPWKHRRKDGTLREVEILSHEVDFSGSAARLVVVNDITERLQAERARREGERQLAALVGSLDDVVFEFDARGTYRQVWARDERLLARPRTEMLGRSIVEVLGEAAGRTFTSACQRVIASGHPEEIEYPMDVGGGRRWFLARVSPVIDADGRRLTASMLVRDITERKAARDALRQSTERFQRYFELGVVGMVISSPTTGMLEANDQICAMLGYTREELLRKTWPEVTHPEDVQTDLSLFRQLLAGEIPSYEMEKRFIRKDGIVLHAHLSVSCVRSPGGAAELVLALIQDVTEQKRAEQALREAEARYRGIFENATEAITQTTPDGRYLTANPAAAHMLGFGSSGDLLSTARNLDQGFYVNPGRRAEFISVMEEQGTVTNFESEVTTKDGSRIWITENSKAVRNPDGSIAYFEGTAQEITARKLAVQALHAANEELEALIRTAPLGVVVLDRQGNVIRWNPANERMFGWTEAEVLGKPLPYVPPGLIEEHQGLRQRVLEGESFSGVEVGRLRKDGSPIGISVFTAPLRDARGQITGILGLNLDITERKHAEDQIRRQLDQIAALRRIDAAIGGTFDLKVMLSIVLDNIVPVLDADAVCISLLAAESMVLEVVAAKGFRTTHIQSSPLALSAGIGIKVMLERSAIHTGDLRMAAEAGRRRDVMQTEQFTSYYGMPLVAKGRVTGLLEVFNRTTKQRTDDWLRLADALAAQTAIAIDSSSMFQDLQRSNVDLGLAYEATIEGWSRALDLRDKETEGHTLRVTELTLQLARGLGMRAEDLAHLRRGALLHDIGKIGVPDSILLKPGPLTDAEWVVMRRHPVVAYEMLAPITYLRPALDIPYCHHEKWDGTGYPRGLKGEEIPLAARLFAVVDVWDALCSERPYRPAWPAEKVLQHIRAESGKHFDPAAVQAFLANLAAAR